MIPQIYEYLYSSFMRLKAPSKLITVLAIILATCWYILNPTGSPYISVPGNRLFFEIPLFKECMITFRNPLSINQYWVMKVNNLNYDTSSAMPINSISIGKNVASLTIKNPYYTNQKTENKTQLYRVGIDSKLSLGFEIEAISIDNHPIEIQFFFKNNLQTKGDYIRLRYIRKDLADIIFLINDPFSNWILTLIFFGIVLLIVRLVKMEVRAYICSDKCFEKYLVTFLNIQDMNLEKYRLDAWDKYAAYWAQWDTWFRYLQAFGPASGFILTVSSLIQALHPIVDASNNIDEFLRGIHVAMISTFLGLLLRIIALEGSRVNDLLLSRTDLLLTKTKNKSQLDSLQSFKGDSAQ